MKIQNEEKEKQIMESKLTFLKLFPLHEIDNNDIKKVCKSYRKKESDLVSCLVMLKCFDEYFYNWYKNNRLCNVFYGER